MIITIELIKDLVENLTGFNLITKSRSRDIVQCRQVAFKLSKELTMSSLSSIGRLYDKDHATVLHGIRKFSNLENQYDFKSAKKLYDKCLSILVPIPDKFKQSEKKEEVIRYVNNKKLTPIQEMVANLTFSQEEELIEMISLRKKSWKWKSKDKLTIYTGS